MPIPTELRQPGARVSYEDRANPRRVGEIVGSLSTGAGDQFRVVWDDRPEREEIISDLRQYGWNLADPLPIIGRERALIDNLARLLLDAAKQRHEWSSLCERPRGSEFEVHMLDPEGDPTGRVARVTIEFDRVEMPNGATRS